MVILYIIFGIIGGLLGGMGMGGGTLLIPLLTIGLSVPQQTAQFINLVAFIPMSALALIVHIRNGYVVKKRIFYVIVPALVCRCGQFHRDRRIRRDSEKSLRRISDFTWRRVLFLQYFYAEIGKIMLKN